MTAENEQRPSFKPKEEIWKLCVEYGDKYKMAPFEVLERFVQVGATAAKIEDAGGIVIGKEGENFGRFNVFRKNGKTS